MTGFTPKVRGLIYERDSDEDGWAVCQWCGKKPRSAHSIQHRRARGMGGSKDPDTNKPSNGVFVDGTGTTGCHGYIEANPDEAESRGFRVPQGVKPVNIPITDWAGRRWFLLDNGMRVQHTDAPF